MAAAELNRERTLKLNAFRSTGKLCDVTVKARRKGKKDAVEFRAHRCILAAASPHFELMFDAGMSEATDGVISLDMDEKVVAQLLDYMYVGDTTIDGESAMSLMPEAAYMQLNKLRDECSSYLSDSVSASNCIQLWLFSSLHSCDALKDKTWKFACANFDNVLACCDMKRMELDDFEKLITDKNLHCKEETVFTAVIDFVSADKEKKEHLPRLLRSVRLCNLDPPFLTGTVGKHPLIKGDPACYEQFIAALETLVGKTAFAKDRYPQGLCAITPSAVKNKWTNVPNVNVNMISPTCAFVHDTLYCMDRDGRLGKLASNGVWSEIAGRCHTYNYPTICASKDELFLLHPDDSHKTIVLRKWNTDSAKWAEVAAVASVSVVIERIGAVCWEDSIFIAYVDGCRIQMGKLDLNQGYSWTMLESHVSDGYNFVMCVTTAGVIHFKYADYTCSYTYDIQRNAWHAVSSHGKGSCTALFGWRGRVLAAFGSSIEMLTDGVWTPLPALNQTRSNCGLAVVGDVLFVMGGEVRSYGRYSRGSNAAGFSVEMLRLGEQ